MERVWCWLAEEGDRGSEGRSCGGDGNKEAETMWYGLVLFC